MVARKKVLVVVRIQNLVRILSLVRKPDLVSTSEPVSKSVKRNFGPLNKRSLHRMMSNHPMSNLRHCHRRHQPKGTLNCRPRIPLAIVPLRQ